MRPRGAVWVRANVAPGLDDSTRWNPVIGVTHGGLGRVDEWSDAKAAWQAGRETLDRDSVWDELQRMSVARIQGWINDGNDAALAALKVRTQAAALGAQDVVRKMDALRADIREGNDWLYQALDLLGDVEGVSGLGIAPAALAAIPAILQAAGVATLAAAALWYLSAAKDSVQANATRVHELCLEAATTPEERKACGDNAREVLGAVSSNTAAFWALAGAAGAAGLLWWLFGRGTEVRPAPRVGP